MQHSGSMRQPSSDAPVDAASNNGRRSKRTSSDHSQLQVLPSFQTEMPPASDGSSSSKLSPHTMSTAKDQKADSLVYRNRQEHHRFAQSGLPRLSVSANDIDTPPQHSATPRYPSDASFGLSESSVSLSSITRSLNASKTLIPTSRSTSVFTTSRARLRRDPSSSSPQSEQANLDRSPSPTSSSNTARSTEADQSPMYSRRIKDLDSTAPPNIQPSIQISYSAFGRSRSGSGSIASQSRLGGDAEVTASVLLWCPTTKTSNSSLSSLSRSPIFRDAQQMKQKLAKLGSSSQSTQLEVGPDVSFERPSSFRTSGPSWLREKPSKHRLNSPISTSSTPGQWKRATAMFRDNGIFTLFGEDRMLVHSIQCSTLTSTDIRPVDDSLFGKPHVLGIYPKPVRISKGASVSTKKTPPTPSKMEPIFLEFADQAQLMYWISLLRIFVQPEIFGSASTLDIGGSHRTSRQIDLTIYDAKSIMPRWPTDMIDSPKSPSVSTGLYAAPPPQYLANNDYSRSTSQSFASSIRQDDYDDSPGSETFGDETRSGSSRGGSRSSSRPSSRPGSRMRHTAKTSLGNMRSFETEEGSASSRAESQAASLHDNGSQAGDDASSISDHAPGPISGVSGAARFPSESSGYNAGSSMANSTSTQRRDDKDMYESSSFDRYCRIRLDGDLVARTSMHASAADAYKVEKFSLKDLPEVRCLTIEVLHPTQKVTSGMSGSPSTSLNKYGLLGIVEIPIESLRRNEEIEGRFPIWSVSTFPTPSMQQQNDEEGKLPTSFHRGVVGELKLSIKVFEETVMPLSMYEGVYRKIHAYDADELIQGLTATLREDSVISHLVRIYAASGTITERISFLIDSESADWGDRMEPELLFRANTLLSRSIDHFQRLLALGWLKDCLGPTVRKICNNSGAARPETSASSAGDASADFGSSVRSPNLHTSDSMQSIPDGPMTNSSLLNLCETMWQNIYNQRHRCPPDLRTALHRIRTTVNERYKSSKSARPGIQGVGAFVFLRLFCAALNTPQLYGLTASQPGRGAQRKLLLLSKVLLAMASKKTAFDKDKDWELTPLNDFLKTYSSAYDDYIIVVSTEPPQAKQVDLLGIRYEDDRDLQIAAGRKLRALAPLHRESIPAAPYMLDQPLALASFVSYVVGAAQEKELESVSSIENLSEASELQVVRERDAKASSGGEDAEQSELQRKRSQLRRKVDEFVDLCCEIEEAAGVCIEKAGYDPKPIPFDRLQGNVSQGKQLVNLGSVVSVGKAASSIRSDPANTSTSSIPSSPSFAGNVADASVTSLLSTNSSFSTIVGGEAGEQRYVSPNSSPSRSRRATVSAAQVRSSFLDHPSTLALSSPAARNGSPASSSRRGSGVFSQSGRRSSTAAEVGGVRSVTSSRRGSEVNVATPGSSSLASSGFIEKALPGYLAQGGDDDMDSDTELKEAYRALRLQEKQAAWEARVGVGANTSTDASRSMGARGVLNSSTSNTGDSGATSKTPPESTPPTVNARNDGVATLVEEDAGSRMQRMDVLMEAEDGSTFVPVYASQGAGAGPPLSRSAGQSFELNRPAGGGMLGLTPVSRSAEKGQPTKAGAESSRSGSEQGGSGGSLARRLGSRSSLISSRRPSNITQSAGAGGAGAGAGDVSRRYSSDQAALANQSSDGLGSGSRRISFTGSPKNRNNAGNLAPISGDSTTLGSSLAPAYLGGNTNSNAAYVGVSPTSENGGGVEKKKRWWKP